jgi:hypothetical protein
MPDETREDQVPEESGKRGPNRDDEQAEVEGHMRPKHRNEDDDEAEVEGHMRPKH